MEQGTHGRCNAALTVADRKYSKPLLGNGPQRQGLYSAVLGVQNVKTIFCDYVALKMTVFILHIKQFLLPKSSIFSSDLKKKLKHFLRPLKVCGPKHWTSCIW